MKSYYGGKFAFYVLVSIKFCSLSSESGNKYNNKPELTGTNPNKKCDESKIMRTKGLLSSKGGG